MFIFVNGSRTFFPSDVVGFLSNVRILQIIIDGEYCLGSEKKGLLDDVEQYHEQTRLFERMFTRVHVGSQRASGKLVLALRPHSSHSFWLRDLPTNPRCVL